MVRMSQKESVQGLNDALELGFSYNLKSRLTAAPCFFVFLRNILDVLDILCLNARTTIGV